MWASYSLVELAVLRTGCLAMEWQIVQQTTSASTHAPGKFCHCWVESKDGERACVLLLIFGHMKSRPLRSTLTNRWAHRGTPSFSVNWFVESMRGVVQSEQRCSSARSTKATNWCFHLVSCGKFSLFKRKRQKVGSENVSSTCSLTPRWGFNPAM